MFQERSHDVTSVSMLQKMTTLCLVSLAVSCLLQLPGLGQCSGVKYVRDKRNADVQQTTPSGDDLTDIIRSLSSTENMLNNLDLMQYTPSTPSPENVNCYVEVPATRRVGGRCVSLGSNAMGCQAGVYLALSSQCQSPSQASRRRFGRMFNRHPFLGRRSRSSSQQAQANP